MRWISIDIETTGLDAERHNIIELGAIAVDTSKHPSTWETYHKIVLHEEYVGSAYAIALNARIFDVISKYESGTLGDSDYEFVHFENLVDDFYNWLLLCGYTPGKNEKIYLNIAGKNVGTFDLRFLGKVPCMKQKIHFKHRIIDPAIFYTDILNDAGVANFETCKKRAGLGDIVTHNAIEDAFDVVFLIMIKIGYAINGMITDEYLDKNFAINEYSGKPHDMWIINDKCSIYRNKSKNPFNRYKVLFSTDSHRYKGFQEVDKVSIWSLQELEKFKNE